MEERLRFVARLLEGERMSDVAREFPQDRLQAVEEIDVPHGASPPTLPTELRETLVRLSAFARQATGWPATRSRRRKMAVQEVSCELLSAPNSLFSSENTGKTAKKGRGALFVALRTLLSQWVTSPIPYSTEQGNMTLITRN